MKVTRPILRYHGGKFRLASWIIKHFPPHRIYTEAFGGAGSVLLQKPRSYSEVYNDKWDEIVDVFRVLRDPDLAKRLRIALTFTPFSRTEFFQTTECSEGDDIVEKVRKIIFRSFAGFGSAAVDRTYNTGFRANSNRSGTTPAHDWANYPPHIEAFVERLRGVVIENKIATELLIQHDSFDTLHYQDPPYPLGTRNVNGNTAYRHEMTDDDHRQLAEVNHELDGMVIISGYPCELYDDELYPTWKRITRKAYADGASKRVEVLWMNAAASRTIQPTLFQ